MEAASTTEPQSESESAQVMLSEPPSGVEQPAEEVVEIDTPAEEQQEDSPVILDETAENTAIITEPQTDDVAETEEEETPELVETTTEEVLEDETAEELAPEVIDEATHINNNDDKRPLRVLFLSDETGGGHRASAEALGKQFMIQYPGSTVEICNLWTEAGDRVFKSIVKSYKHMSASPWQWKLFYHATNTKVVEVIGKNHSNIFCAEKVKARISEFQPDAVISVHPTMNHLARIQTRLIGKELGKHIPFYTVVTDLGSAHGTWFQREVNKIYVASNNLVQLALDRRIPPAKIVRTGLPIRHGFAVQAKALHGNRTLEESKQYIMQIRTKLGLIEKEEEEEEEKEPAKEGEAEERESASAPPKPTPMILVMGGGEGVGSLSDIVNQLYATLTLEGQDATVCVVCGRNEALKEELENRDWFAVVEGALQERIRRRNMSRTFRERIMTSAPPPPNFCSPDTILCDGDSGLLPALISANRYNSVDGPKSMEQVMAEAAMLPSPLSSSPPSDSPMNDASLTRSPLMKLITKLPGINEKKAPPPPLLTDAAPKEDDDDDDDDEDDVGLNPPTPPTPQQAPPAIQPGRVNVVGLGFVTNMEEYMVAADVLVTKAGPGTIAEAAAVGLPVMLTSYLPGQEAGNVDVVLEAGFGDYCVDPFEISARVCSWLKDYTIIDEMSRKAHKAGHPHAADDIVADIGSETITWMKMNERWKGDPIYKPFIELGHTLVLDSYLHDKTEVENLARASSEHKMASTESTRRSFATAAVGVGAAVGAVMAGPLLPVGLMVGSAVIPALPVGLVVGGGLSGLAANQLNKQEARNAAEAAAEETDEEGKEEKKEERDDEAPKSRFFGWGSNPTSPASDEVTGESAPVDATAAAKSKWFGWGASRKAADAVGNESLAPETNETSETDDFFRQKTNL